MTKPTIKSQLECRELKDTSAGSSWAAEQSLRPGEGASYFFFNIVLELSPNSTGLNEGDPDTICHIRTYKICVIIF